jgi:hypothetical protein
MKNLLLSKLHPNIMSSLWDQQRAIREQPISAEEEQKNTEAAILRAQIQGQANTLLSSKELASGIIYTESLTTTWNPPRFARDNPVSSWFCNLGVEKGKSYYGQVSYYC